MKDNGIKISRGLESLIKKREVISVDTPEKEEEPVAIEPEKETVKTNSILNRLTIIKDVEEDDEEEIETLVSEEIRPSFLDRIQSVKKEEAKSTNEDDVVKKVVEEQKLSYEELKEKYEHTMSLNLRSIKLIDKYEAELAKKNKTIARQNEIIAKQKDLIEKFRKTQGLKKRK